MTQSPIPAKERYMNLSYYTKTSRQTALTQRLRTVLGRSVWLQASTQLVLRLNLEGHTFPFPRSSRVKYGTDLTQTYDKSPYTHRQIQKATRQHKKRHQKLWLHNDCGPTWSVGVTAVTPLVWLNRCTSELSIGNSSHFESWKWITWKKNSLFSTSIYCSRNIWYTSIIQSLTFYSVNLVWHLLYLTVLTDPREIFSKWVNMTLQNIHRGKCPLLFYHIVSRMISARNVLIHSFTFDVPAVFIRVTLWRLVFAIILHCLTSRWCASYIYWKSWRERNDWKPPVRCILSHIF